MLLVIENVPEVFSCTTPIVVGSALSRLDKYDCVLYILRVMLPVSMTKQKQILLMARMLC